MLVVVLGFVALVTLSATFQQWDRFNRGDAEQSPFSLAVCGLTGLVSLLATAYLVTAVIKALRDLSAPIVYTRGTVVEKRDVRGRKPSNWLMVAPTYVGPDLSQASAVSDEHRQASRPSSEQSRIYHPRYASDDKEQPSAQATSGSYLPASRISTDQAAPASTSELDSSQRHPRGILFRVDKLSSDLLDANEEVLVAHSRYLQHVFFVSHLRGGEWESFPNKQLI